MKTFAYGALSIYPQGGFQVWNGQLYVDYTCGFKSLDYEAIR